MCKEIIRQESEKGAALITAIFSLLIATVISVALYYSAMISFTVAINDRDNTEAFYLADAGINHAVALINKASKDKYSAILTAGANSSPNSGDELSVPPVAGLWTTAQSIPAGNSTSGGVTNFGAGGQGRYFVSVRNDTATGETPTVDANGVLIVTSTGVARDGATATVEVTVQNGSSNLPAILINGNVALSGNPSIEGTNGILHANGNITLSGSPCTDAYFSASGTISNPTKLKGAGCSGVGNNRPNQPIIPSPVINVRQTFYGKTDYLLGAIGTQAGKVYNSLGQLILDTNTTGKKWVSGSMTWTWDPTNMLWIQTGNSIINGSYYSEGNIAIAGNFGSNAFPASVTFIAEGFLYNQGKQYLAPYYNSYSLVAGTDIKLSGKLTQAETDSLELDGITYANHQIDFAGTPVLRGTVIAANQADTNSPGCNCNLVPLDSSGNMNIHGNPTIISDGGNANNVDLKFFNWREVRY